MGSDADAIVGLYERHAGAWVEARLRGPRLAERGWLEKFSATAGAGAVVLDLGCGAGAPIAAWLVGQGHPVVGVDSSARMIALFRERLPLQEALVADMRSLALGREFRGVLAWDSFFHLDFDAQRRMFPIFRAHAAPGAALMFTSGPAHGEALGVLEGETLYHASLAPAEYRTLLAAHGFELVEMVAEDASCGGRTVWLARSR